MFVVFLIVNLIIAIGMLIVALAVLKLKNVLYILLITLGPPLLIDFLIFIIWICLNHKIKRIDCIYSTDFNKMFIGTKTINKKCYKNTFEFQLSEISRFHNRKNGKKNYLSIIVNNKDIDICEIPDILDLDSFITILNEKINKLQIIKNS